MFPDNCYGLVWYLDDVLVRVELEDVVATVKVRGFVAHLEATLRYRNDERTAQQCVFHWPVDESSAVYRMQAKVEDRVIIATCMEKKKAEKIYTEAVDSGRTAMIMREESLTADVISLTIGNLPPKSVTEITLSVVTELSVGTDGGVQYTLPTVLNPRYCPADTAGTDPVPCRSDGVPLAVVDKPYLLSVSGSVVGALSIVRVVSHSDPITVHIEDDGAQAKITQTEGYRSDHDWSFVVYYNNPYTPQLIVETGDSTAVGIMKDQVIMLNLYPEIPEGSYSHRNEVIFVVDRSGSMQGENIQSARAVLLLFLKSLPPGCLFNIVSFGNTYTLLFKDGSREYCKDTLDKACKLHDKMDADMGGTEILEPLRFIYSKEPSAAYSRQILLLTDGQVFNVDQICGLVERNAGNTRVFAVGIGEGASTALVRGLARAGRGRAEMVTQRDRVQTKVMGLVASMLQSSVQNVEVKWKLQSATRISLVPAAPPTIFAGQQFTAYARMPPNAVVEGVVVTGEVDGKQFRSSAGIEQVKTVHDTELAIHRLAARAIIRSQQTDDTDDSKAAVVELSVNTGVLSRHTALVAVDQDGKQLPIQQAGPDSYDNCMPVHRRQYYTTLGGGQQNQILKLSSQSYMSSNASVAFGSVMCNSPPSMATRNIEGPFSDINSYTSFYSNNEEIKSKKKSKSFFSRIMTSASVPPDTVDTFRAPDDLEQVGGFGEGITMSSDESEENRRTKSRDKMFMQIVSQQKFDGSWELNDVANTLGVTLHELQQHIIKGVAKGDDALATALVIAVLEEEFDDRKVEWSLLVNKASKYLQQHCSSGSVTPDTVSDAAKKCIEALKGRNPQLFSFK
uniref:von Willebrand factor A domain-containing protein 5A-like n=1 Tax=Hirondellea gigas TaxID=1518452 RepID=A0A2P2I2A9_9CRUS